MSDFVQSTDSVGLLGRALRSVATHVRPELRPALSVLYWGAVGVLIAWVSALIYRAFGEHKRVDYELIAYFVAPLGIGALTSGWYDSFTHKQGNLQAWLSCTIFGAVTGLVFWVLITLKNRGHFDPVTGVGVTVGVAVLFLSLRWLMLKEQKRVAV